MYQCFTNLYPKIIQLWCIKYPNLKCHTFYIVFRKLSGYYAKNINGKCNHYSSVPVQCFQDIACNIIDIYAHQNIWINYECILDISVWGSQILFKYLGIISKYSSQGYLIKDMNIDLKTFWIRYKHFLNIFLPEITKYFSALPNLFPLCWSILQRDFSLFNFFLQSKCV